jgi:OHS family lactose permease-like MFS transporter
VKEKVPVTEQMAFLKQPMFLLFALITIVYMSMIGLNNTFAPILLQDLGVPTSFIGTMLLVSTLFEVPLVFFSNKFMNRFSGKLLAAASCVLLMIQFLVYGLCGNVVVVCIAMMLKAVCSQLFVMTMLKVVHGIVRESAVSTALGLISSANAVGSIIAHNVSGFCVEAAGIPALYLVLGGIGALVFVLSLFVKTKATTSTFF